MHSRNLRSILGFFLLAVGVYLLREDHGSTRGYVLSTSLVFVFWYLNDLSLALSNLRNLLVLASVFGIALIAVQLAFPTPGESAKMGLSAADLNPAIIGRLKESHELALDVYFDHKPSKEERYFKIGNLPFTDDGVHYTSKKHDIEPEKLPRTAAWVQANLLSGRLNSDLQKIRTWFMNSFSYTLTPGSLHSSSPLDEFLFESRKGFCEHYAASLSTLLKLRGYKARVSVGYEGGRWNPLFRLLTYEESNAHAWVEVLDPMTQKWRTVDPTEWVLPGGAEGQSNGMIFWIVAFALFLFVVTMIFLIPVRAEGIDVLLDKLNAMEIKNHLESAGLTLSERISRMAALYPDRAESMQASLSIYLASYFANEPTQIEKKNLVRSISRWGKP